MASRLLRYPACRLRASPNATSLRPAARAFHASAPRQDAVLETLLYLPHEMMTLIHTQVPWYAALPISAFLLRGALVTTFGTWSRSHMARYVGLQPLRQALARQKRDEISRQGNFRTPKEGKKRILLEVKQAVARLDKSWGVTITGQIGWTFIQLPIFISMAEVIRQMCGARNGLLALSTSVFKSKDNTDAIESAAADGMAAVVSSPFFEPSLANEGLLWFQNLVVPDPTGALPFIVSGLMFSNIYFSKNAAMSGANWPNLVRRLLLGISLLVGPLCQDLPAALMLYWASSTSSVMLWNVWLDWKHPAPTGLLACNRPLQMPPVMKFQPRRI